MKFKNKRSTRIQLPATVNNRRWTGLTMAKILDLLKTEGKFSQAELKRVRGSLDHMSLADDHKISWL